MFAHSSLPNKSCDTLRHNLSDDMCMVTNLLHIYSRDITENICYSKPVMLEQVGHSVF